MHERFASARRGAHEHDYVETADYAEAFLHEVKRLGRVKAAGAAERAPREPERARPAPAARDPDRPVVIRTFAAGGVWHVTRDQVFLGDYLAEGPACDAAAKAARDITSQGGRAELVFAPPP